MKKLFLTVALSCAAASASIAAPAEPLLDDDIGCRDKEIFDRLVKFGTDGDQEAFMKLGTAAVLSGKCIMLKKGQKVFVEDTSFWAGTACVRPQGNPYCYHTHIENILKSTK